MNFKAVITLTFLTILASIVSAREVIPFNQEWAFKKDHLLLMDCNMEIFSRVLGSL